MIPPFINMYYRKNAGRLKRNFCLMLNKFGLLKPFTFVQWLATYKCNLHCPYCEASAGEAGLDELSMEEVKTLIDDLAKMKVENFLISGGEPFARPDLISIMRYAARKKLQLGLVTNGYYIEGFWKELKDFNYFIYFTSMDGEPEYHDKIRAKPGAFKKALKGLELFGELGVKMRMVNTVVSPENIGQLEELLKILKETPANIWHLTPVSKVGRAEYTNKFSLNKEQLKYLLDFIRKNTGILKIDLGESHTYLGCFEGGPVGKPFFCGAGLTRCSIMPDGEVLGCQQVYDNSLSEGNIRQRPFSQIWKNGFERFREKRKLPNYCNGCIYLSSCLGGCWAEMEKQGMCLKAIWMKED